MHIQKLLTSAHIDTFLIQTWSLFEKNNHQCCHLLLLLAFVLHYFHSTVLITMPENNGKWCQIIIIIDTYYNRGTKSIILLYYQKCTISISYYMRLLQYCRHAIHAKANRICSVDENNSFSIYGWIVCLLFIELKFV